MKSSFITNKMFPNIFSRKKINNCGLNIRSFAAMLDISLILILFMPIFGFVSNLLHNDNSPGLMLSKALIANSNETKDFSYNLNNAINSAEFQTYLYENHGLLKFAFDQIFQLTVFVVVVLLFWFKKQSTPGKMIFKMKIVDYKSKRTPTKLQLVIRFLSYIISTIPLFLGFIWIAFNKDNRGWHDFIAGTQVIREQK